MPTPPAPLTPPRWARVVDVLFVLLLILAVIVALWGGFRFRLLDVRISLMSPGRLLIWAMVLAALRHFIAPQAPIYERATRVLRSAWRAPDLREAVRALVATRLAVLFAGYLAVFLFGYAQGSPPFRLSPNEFLNLQARWDTGWYVGIASRGYRPANDASERQRNIVFFPALPFLMRVAGRMLGGSSPAYLMGGTLIVLLALMGALVYLFRLARSLLGDEDQAKYAVWLIAAYPFALFFSAVYTESLFLLGALGAFYHFRRREFGYAAAWGLFVGLTRPNGCFLSIPLALLALTPWLPPWLTGTGVARAEDRPASLGQLAPALAAAAMPGLGVLLYSGFIWSLTGNPLEWAAGHLAWGRSYSGLSVLVTERYEYLWNEGLYAYTSRLPHDLLQALGPAFVLAAVWGVFRRLGVAYVAFVLVNLLPPLAAGGLLSAGRFSAVLFPVFIWFAARVPAGQRPGWIAAFMALQAFNAALFYTWRPMY